jgi:hypothetical protein
VRVKPLLLLGATVLVAIVVGAASAGPAHATLCSGDCGGGGGGGGGGSSYYACYTTTLNTNSLDQVSGYLPAPPVAAGATALYQLVTKVTNINYPLGFTGNVTVSNGSASVTSSMLLAPGGSKTIYGPGVYVTSSTTRISWKITVSSPGAYFLGFTICD